ncbi:MAG: hypothetical protein IKP37_02855 [Paludibacteraceae bacterium]|nr:hypothetical protein [Paludibacteraceae bacterium]
MHHPSGRRHLHNRGEALGPTRHQIRLEDDISVTGGGAPGRTHHTLLPGRQYLNNHESERKHGKHTCTTRLEDGISITGGEAPGQTHRTLLPGRQYINNRVCGTRARKAHPHNPSGRRYLSNRG